MKLFLLLPLIALLSVGAAHAELKDSQQPTKIEADQMIYDNAKQTKTFTGNVVLTRGTLLINAGKVVMQTNASGHEFATLYAAPGKLASLRQKRDGAGDLWIEGEAERIEYDDNSEVAKLFGKAHMRRLTGKNVTDEVNGEFISYDSRTEVYSAKNSVNNAAPTGNKRITAIIQPRTDSTKE